MLRKEQITEILDQYPLFDEGDTPAINRLLEAQEQATRQEMCQEFGKWLESKSCTIDYGSGGVRHNWLISDADIETLKSGNPPWGGD